METVALGYRLCWELCVSDNDNRIQSDRFVAIEWLSIINESSNTKSFISESYERGDFHVQSIVYQRDIV